MVVRGNKAPLYRFFFVAPDSALVLSRSGKMTQRITVGGFPHGMQDFRTKKGNRHGGRRYGQRSCPDGHQNGGPPAA